MDFLRIFFIFIFLIGKSALAADKFLINDVNIICDVDSDCSEISQQYDDLKNVMFSEADLREKMKFYLLDKTLKKFEYEVVKNNGKVTINISIGLKKIISTIEFVSNVKVEFGPLRKQLLIKEDKPLTETDIKKSKKIIRKYFEDRGFTELNIIVDTIKSINEVVVNINVIVGNLVDVSAVKILYPKGAEQFKELEKILLEFKSEPWNKYKFLYEVDKLTQELFNQGYFFASAKSNEPKFSPDKKSVELSVFINSGKRYNFNFIGNKLFTHQELLLKIRDNIRNSFGEFSLGELKEILSKQYEERGIFNTAVHISSRTGKDRFNRLYKNYFIKINEGHKIAVSKVSFIGNRKITNNEIKNLYYEESSVLADRDYLDIKYSSKFSKVLKNLYLKKGYIFSVIDEPLFNFNSFEKTVVVEYKIKERQQSLISKITLEGIDESLKKKILPKLTNKIDAPLNVIELENDLSTIVDIARDNGYFYATVINSGKKDLISYESNYSRASINVKLDAGKKTIFDSSLITGLNKTKLKVVEREVGLIRGETLTPKKVLEIRKRIYSLGLFSLVRVSPFVKSSTDVKNYHVNLLVQLQEKDFGAGEVGPGYRTDIGYKLATGISYNNLWGKNHSISGKLQANLRDNFNNLDVRRSREENRLIEYSVNTQYSWPYIFWSFLNTKIDFDISSSFRRKRFYDFDADIFKISPRLSKKFNKYFGASIKYQFETIGQFDATDSIDNDSFRIGGITPGITLDFRNNAVAPTKGAFFSLSWEFANPRFGSMNEEDLEVNFSKLVSRNNLYLPVARDVTIATSISFGVEKNYAKEYREAADGSDSTKGFIPSVKVFRLDGSDSVRGFRSNEINLLESGDDIGNVVIRDKAFFTNIKIEPRYYASDAFVLGVFFDAGRVFVNSYKPLDLRTSAGATVKLLTPVGSLNLDYGVKLQRKNLPSGGRESFGRFHLSIGFF
jgi:outer membrane protein insertion porin family